MRMIERLREAVERFAAITEEKRRGGGSAIKPADREEIARFVSEVWHEDCEWFPLIGGVEGSTYRGRDRVAAFYEDLWGTFEVDYHDQEFRVVGDSIVYLASMKLRGRESGIDLQSELGVVYVLDGDWIRVGRAYDSHAAALAAAQESDA